MGLSVALGGTNSANQFVDTITPPITRIHTSSVGVVSSSAVSFQTRYALALGTDIGNNATITESHTANYTITFAVNHTAGVPWALNIDTGRLGALTLVDDGTGARRSRSGRWPEAARVPARWSAASGSPRYRHSPGAVAATPPSTRPELS